MASHDYDRAVIGLRIISARFFGDSLISSENILFSKATNFVEGVILKIGEQDSARMLAETVTHAAADLRSLLGGACAAADELDQLAALLNGSPSISSHVSTASVAKKDRCEILNLVREIEAEVRIAYTEACNLSPGIPQFFYKTELLPASKPYDHLGGINFGGGTDISVDPRVVSLVVRNVGLSGVDLSHLSYVIFHELVCHGFQVGGRRKGQQNAPSVCHWSEGWMDAVAAEMAIDWIEKKHFGLHPWAPSEFFCPKEKISDAHRGRYMRRPDYGATFVYRRLSARLAYDRFCSALRRLADLGGCDSRSFARNFSLAVNAHDSATTEGLRSISSCLQAAFSRPDLAPLRAIRAVEICCDYMNGSDFSQLHEQLCEVATEGG